MAMSTGGDSGGPMSEINVTPLVDVMLVLLIIFMITAPLMSHRITVDLPTANPKVPDTEQVTPMDLAVKPDGTSVPCLANFVAEHEPHRHRLSFLHMAARCAIRRTRSRQHLVIADNELLAAI